MTFDFKNENLWLMKGDCLERMKEIQRGSVDMVLTDPPYGTVNGVADGEIWILAFDGGTSNLFTITCTTSAGEWQIRPHFLFQSHPGARTWCPSTKE